MQTTSTGIIPVATADDEYRALCDRLERDLSMITASGLDFSKISGRLDTRTAKALVLHLACTGRSTLDIAVQLDLKPALVARYLADALEEAVPIEAKRAILALELRKLDEEERAAWTQFRRSCEDEQTVVVTDKPSGAETRKTTKGQSGNPAYLRTLIDIAKRRAALLGLDAPTKTEINKREQTLKITQVIVRTHDEADAFRASEEADHA